MSYPQHPPPHYQRPRGMSVPTTGLHAANLPPPPPGPPPNRRRSNQTIYPPPWSNNQAPPHASYSGYRPPQAHAPPPGPPPAHHPGHAHSHSHSAHHHSRGYSVPSMPPGPPPSAQQHGTRPRRQSVQSGAPPPSVVPPQQPFPQSILKNSPSTKRVHFAESVEGRSEKENSGRSRSSEGKGGDRKARSLQDFHVMLISALEEFENMEVSSEQELARRLPSLVASRDDARMRDAIAEFSRLGAQRTGKALLQMLIDEFRSACEGEIAASEKHK
ncbi:hypothetical protein HDK90DRAFT_302529 [Phyllosticta capitalensis]|uniref:Uncharacterized protein n=1 Tax=Phyllosticta capitalensis TaxID=121624 RepID=A0ABR1YKD9_9PEZI